MTQPAYDFSAIKAIIGLGNPGAKYYHTRHNIGFRIVDIFVDYYAGQWRSSELMEHAQVLLPDRMRSIDVIKSLTYMNNSGRVIPFLLKKGIKSEEIIVIHDELEKPFGKMSIRLGGSARGHNGLRSIMSVLGESFWRVRFGIGRPEEKSQVGNYVLTRFLKEEEDLLMERVEGAIALLCGEGG